MMDLNLGATKTVLDGLAARSRAVLHNVANQNTPGFKRYRVHFEDALRQAHERGDTEAKISPTIVRDTSGPPGVNNVDVMEELSLLGKVTLMHDVFSKRAAGYFSHLNRAIRGS